MIYVCASNNESSNTKQKAESSFKTYSALLAPDFSNYGSPNFENTLSFFKSLEGSPISSIPHLNQHKIGKSTVEFWPPDMDKKKFFTSMVGGGDSTWHSDPKLKVEPVVYTEVESSEYQTDLPPIAELPESLPDIPIHNYEEIEVYEKKAQIPLRKFKPIVEDQVEILKIKEPVKEVFKIENYENYNHPRFYQTTEKYYNEDYAITDSGPVRFPISEPDTFQTSHDYNSAATPLPAQRAGNKKRKLKKKVKTTQNNIAHFYETTVADYNTPPTDVTVNAILPENVHVQIIEGNGFDAGFQPVRYTNVIDSVSNLTEMSFGNDERSRNTAVEEVKEVKIEKKSESSERSSRHQNNRGKMVNELKPWDFMFVQLSRAIEDRDLVKIKTLVNAISEKEKSRKVKKVSRGRVTSTTVAPFEEITSVAPILTTTEASEIPSTTTVEITEPPTTTVSYESTTPQRKRYLAPRIRLSLKKIMQDIASSNETASSLSTETQTFAARPSTLPMTLRVFTTTEESTTETPITVAVTERLNTTPRVAQRLRFTTERVRDVTTPAIDVSTTFVTRSRRGRIVTPRNKKLKESITTTATTINSSTMRTIRNSSRVRRIKGFRRMTGLNRY